MIVNPTEFGLEIIFQPAHALLSAQVAARTTWAGVVPHWWQTLVAVAQHDNGWHEWEQAPTLNGAGSPRNFTEMTPQDAIAQWRRGVGRGLHQGRWVGLLISRHATSLYEARRGEVAALDAFLDEQGAQQARWIEALGVTEGEVARAYDVVRWSDWFSLVLCWRRVPEDGSAISLGAGPDGQGYTMRRLDGERLTVEPWPFIEARFVVTVEARRLFHPTFEEASALKQALEGAEIQLKSWQITQSAA